MKAYPILVVDDDESIRSTVASALQLEGYPVETAAGGWAALQSLTATEPHLILLDMRMPDLDGWNFTLEARARGSVAHIVVMTAAHDADAWAVQVAADGVLPKPFELDDLLAEVERLCTA